MEFLKKHKKVFIVAGVALLVVILACASIPIVRREIRLRSNGTYDNNFDIGDFEDAMKVVKKNYPQWAQLVEQVYRLESGNFTSTQYKQTGTAGMMVPAGAGWPFYGWSKLFFSTHPHYAPLGSVDDTNLKTLDPNWQGGKKIFVVLPSVEAGAMFLAYWLNAGNPVSSWGGGGDYANVVAQQATTIADNT